MVLEMYGMRTVPQLLIDGSEEFCPGLRDRDSLETYLELRLRQSDRSILSTEFHPPHEKKVENILLVEVHTVNRSKVISGIHSNLVPILENGILDSSKAAHSIRKGSDTIGPDVSKALSFWNDLINAVEAIESIDGNLHKKSERLLETTTEMLREFDEAVKIEDPEIGADVLRKLAEISGMWIKELGRLTE